MHHKLITLLLAIVGVVLLSSCGAPRYVTIDNQVYALPGDKVTIEVKTNIESLTGVWESYYNYDQEVGEWSILPVQLSLRTANSSNEITATVTPRRYAIPDSLANEPQIVIIPVEITVPADAAVPSTWSGFLTGAIMVAEAVPGKQFKSVPKIMNVVITLHVTTQEEITKQSQK